MPTDLIERSDPTPLSLIQDAIDKGMSADQLSRFFDLQERWEANQAKQAYATAMNACQSELPMVVKDATNTHTKSKYATLEAVNVLVNPIVARHELGFSFTEEESKIEGCRRVVAVVRHVGGHSERFQVDIPLDGVGAKGNANMNPVQAFGSTMAYARRYLKLMALDLTILNEDNDGNAAEPCLSDLEIEILRTKCHEHFNAGIGGYPSVEDLESKFVSWLAKEQRTPDATTLEDIHASLFPRAMKTLDDKMRKHLAGGAA